MIISCLAPRSILMLEKIVKQECLNKEESPPCFLRYCVFDLKLIFGTLWVLLDIWNTGWGGNVGLQNVMFSEDFDVV